MKEKNMKNSPFYSKVIKKIITSEYVSMYLQDAFSDAMSDTHHSDGSISDALYNTISKNNLEKPIKKELISMIVTDNSFHKLQARIAEEMASTIIDQYEIAFEMVEEEKENEIYLAREQAAEDALREADKKKKAKRQVFIKSLSNDQKRLMEESGITL